MKPYDWIFALMYSIYGSQYVLTYYYITEYNKWGHDKIYRNDTYLFIVGLRIN